MRLANWPLAGAARYLPLGVIGGLILFGTIICVLWADPNLGERHLRHAIDPALNQDTKLWELRATTSLGRLVRDTGRREKARAKLGEIYNWFTEGFDTADLKDAKALLDELSR